MYLQVYVYTCICIYILFLKKNQLINFLIFKYLFVFSYNYNPKLFLIFLGLNKEIYSLRQVKYVPRKKKKTSQICMSKLYLELLKLLLPFD